MTNVVPPQIKELFGGRVAGPDFALYQDVGETRRFITTDIERGVFTSVEVSSRARDSKGLAEMILALTYRADGSFSFAYRYSADGEAQPISEGEGLRQLAELLKGTWFNTGRGMH